MKKLRLKLLTPKKTLFDDAVDFVLLRTTKGDMGILPAHEPYAVLLANGILRAFVARQEVGVFRVQGGSAMVQNNEVTVLTELAAPPEEMEALRTAMEQEREQRRQREVTANLETHRAEEALRRALVHTEVSTDAIIKGHASYAGESE